MLTKTRGGRENSGGGGGAGAGGGGAGAEAGGEESPYDYLPGITPDRTTVEMCLGAAACALGMVMAGTGELTTLRLLRKVRLTSVGKAEKRDSGATEGEEGKKDTTPQQQHEPGKYSTYGHHQAIASSIGLLFLGGGRATLSRTNEAIAALVVAFFPRYPLSTADNRYHLQSLRHLYVLAVDYRIVNAIDVDTGTSCLVRCEACSILMSSSSLSLPCYSLTDDLTLLRMNPQLFFSLLFFSLLFFFFLFIYI